MGSGVGHVHLPTPLHNGLFKILFDRDHGTIVIFIVVENSFENGSLRRISEKFVVPSN